MPIYAFKSGVTIFDEATMNALLSAQPSSLIFDGTQVAASTGTGTTEFNLSISDLYTAFILTGQTTIGRIELEIKKYGAGADLTVEIRQGAVNGTLKGTFKFPAKLFSTSYVSLPIDLSLLTAGATYFIVLKQAGDTINHLRWIGESGGTAHCKVFANTPGTYVLKHGIYGENAKTSINYDANGQITEIWRWLNAVDGSLVICDKMVPTYDANGIAIKWAVI